MRQTTSKVLVNRSHRIGRILADDVSLSREVLRTIAVYPLLQYRQEVSITGCLSRFGSKDDRCDNSDHAETLASSSIQLSENPFCFEMGFWRLCDAKIGNNRYSALWTDRGCKCQPL